MSLPPTPSFTCQPRRHRSRCKLFAGVTSMPIALTCSLLLLIITGVFMRNAQAGVIKKREIPSIRNVDDMSATTTPTTTTNVLASSIRALSNDPDIEVRELNQPPQSMAATELPRTKLVMQGMGSLDGSHEESMHNDLSLDPSVAKKANPEIIEQENANGTPRWAPLSTENPILKLANNLSGNFQQNLESFSSKVSQVLNDIHSKEVTQEKSQEIASGSSESTGSSNSDAGNIMVLTAPSKEKTSDILPTEEKKEHREPNQVGENVNMEAGTGNPTNFSTSSQDVEVMNNGADGRPVLSVSSTHENLAKPQEDHQKGSQEVAENSADSSRKVFTTEIEKETLLNPLKGNENSHESQNALQNSQESENGVRSTENPQKSQTPKINNGDPSKGNAISQEGQSTAFHESQSRGHSLNGNKNSHESHNDISQESQSAGKINIQENPQIKTGNFQEEAQNESLQGSQGAANLNKQNFQESQSPTMTEKENPQDSQKSQNIEEDSHESGSHNENNLKPLEASMAENTLAKIENTQEFQKSNDNTQQNQLQSIAENSQESQSSSPTGNVQESQRQQLPTIQGNSHVSQNTIKSPSGSENLQESQNTEEIQKENTQKSTNDQENSQESQNTLNSENPQESQISLKSPKALDNSQEVQSTSEIVKDDSQSINNVQESNPESQSIIKSLNLNDNPQESKKSPNAAENSQESQNTFKSANDSESPQETFQKSQIFLTSPNASENPQESENPREMDLKLASNEAINDLSSSKENGANMEKSAQEKSLQEIAENNGKSGDIQDSTKMEVAIKSSRKLEEDVNSSNNGLNEISSKESLAKPERVTEKEMQTNGEKLSENSPKNVELQNMDSKPSSNENNVQIQQNIDDLKQTADFNTQSADSTKQSADLARTPTTATNLKDNSLETNHINEKPTVFSKPIGDLGNKFVNSSGIQDALDGDSWKEVTNDLPDKTTEKIPEEEVVGTQKPLDKVEYGRAMFQGKEGEGEEATTLPGHIANNIDFGEVLQQNSTSNSLRPKQPKFINDNSSNAQQMNLPNNPEVWSLAGMKNPNANNVGDGDKKPNREQVTTMKSERMEMRDNLDSQLNGLSEKSLLDWSHIMTDKELIQATTEEYGEEVAATNSDLLLGNTQTNAISANSTILSMGNDDDKAATKREEEKIKETGEEEGITEQRENNLEAVGGVTEKSVTETFVASHKSEDGMTHGEQPSAAPADTTNLTSIENPQTKTTTRTAVATDETILTLERPDREQSFINNITESGQTSAVTTETAVGITESPTQQKTTVEPNVNSFVETSAENTTTKTTATGTSDVFELNTEKSNYDEVKENRADFTEVEVTTYKPKFVIATTTTSTSIVTLPSQAIEGSNETVETTTTNKIPPLAEVIDQNGNNLESIDIETTTTPPSSTQTTTLAAATQEPTVEEKPQEEGQFSSSTIKTHLNEQLANNSTTTTNNFTTTATDIPFELTTIAAKENTTTSSSGAEEGVKEEIIGTLGETTTPKTQQAAKEEEEEDTQEGKQQTTSEQGDIIIGLATTTTTTAKPETKATEATEEEELEQATEITTTTATPASETPVANTSEIFNGNLGSVTTTTTTSRPELNSDTNKDTTKAEAEGEGADDEKVAEVTTTEKGVETYFKFPIRGGSQTATPTITTTPTINKEEREPEIEGSGDEEGYEQEGIKVTDMSLPETSTSERTTAVTEETFISLLDDSTTTTSTSTTTTTELPPIIITTTTTERLPQQQQVKIFHKRPLVLI
ncbi:serine-rich adhesin for platelets-like [Musca vetustissima]|uniref:serine-rich adhesin for platelets-like n=1 Tax=Musca vetustissima TaxID=27455 RepID=UPI002AB770CD|nr:serine-rich adhesin for platelets-like [Musca vetustissima]